MSICIAFCFVIGVKNTFPLGDLKGRGMKKNNSNDDTGIPLTSNNQCINNTLVLDLVNFLRGGKPQYLATESLDSSSVIFPFLFLRWHCQYFQCNFISS